MKKSVCIVVMITLIFMALNYAFAYGENELVLLNACALGKTDNDYAQKVLLVEEVYDIMLIEEVYVNVKYNRTTTVDCQGRGQIACLKGNVEISDIEIVKE